MATHDNPRYVKLDDVLEAVKAHPTTEHGSTSGARYSRAAWDYRRDVLAAIEALPSFDWDADCDDAIQWHLRRVADGHGPYFCTVCNCHFPDNLDEDGSPSNGYCECGGKVVKLTGVEAAS